MKKPLSKKGSNKPNERRFISFAIQEAQRSHSEDGRVHPKVGVVVRDNKILVSAHRGEIRGNHAEFIALEKKLKNTSLVGATVYTTLEPCTDRNHPKIPCAKRLVEHKVARVVIGMLDPNPKISGKGQQLLRNANIAIELFPEDLMKEVEALNRDFIRSHNPETNETIVDSDFLRLNSERPLDEWYRVICAIYRNRNFHRDSMSIFAHLVEVVGGLSALASQKRIKGKTSPTSFVPKGLAWWMALCRKVNVRSVEDMIWAKFPGICPYCHRCPHDPRRREKNKQAHDEPDWKELRRISMDNRDLRPKSLGGWQKMFSEIYPAHKTEGYGRTFARLTEELGELAESLRIFSELRGSFVSEAADVFAWLMHIQNLIDLKNRTLKADHGNALTSAFCMSYPDCCIACKASPCKCPPILESTIGRITHDMPNPTAFFG